MSTTARITGGEFDSMIQRGAFDGFEPRKIELIHGELRVMNPAGSIHDDYILYLTRWSTENTNAKDCAVSVQCGFACDDHRPEPDILWLKPKRYGRSRPTATDVLLLIEVSDSSVSIDLQEKADLYAAAGVAEYWVIDVPASRIHVLKSSDGKSYRDIQVIVPPKKLAPAWRSDATLDTEDLFSVR